MGEVIGVPISFGKITRKLSFLLAEESPFDLILGGPSMKAMREVLDFDHGTATSLEGAQFVRVPLWSEGIQELGVVSNELTLEDEGTWEETDDGSDEQSASDGLVLCLTERAQDIIGYTEEEAVSQVHSHLECCEQKEIRKALFAGGSIIAWRFDELRPSSVPYIHTFQISDQKPICLRARRMAAKHNEVGRNEINCMVDSHLIKPTKSPWGFPVLIAAKQYDTQRFCANYRALNNVMIADRDQYQIWKTLLQRWAAQESSRSLICSQGIGS